VSNLDPERWRLDLKQSIYRCFNNDELNALIYDLNITEDDIHGNTRETRAKNLVEYMERRKRLPELVAKLREKRPKESWADPLAKNISFANNSVSPENPDSQQLRKTDDRQSFFQRHGWVIPVITALITAIITGIFTFISSDFAAARLVIKATQTAEAVSGIYATQAVETAISQVGIPNQPQEIEVTREVTRIVPEIIEVTRVVEVEVPVTVQVPGLSQETVVLEEASEAIGYPLSCLEILESGQSQGDDYYTIDPDGAAGRLEPFEVYCNMSRQDGGWTLYAYHADGIAVFEVENVTLDEPGVILAERWRAIRDTMTTGMLFVDELGRETTLSARKLNEGNCQNVQNPDSLVPAISAGSQIWHYENSGCSVSGQDYSIIILLGPSYSGFNDRGAALTQLSGYKFDDWPYSNPSTSYGEQNELYYYIK
jgi:hypothetical protein